MSTNYENAVHGRRRVSMVNDSNANRQEDSRLNLELQKIEREKAKLSRRKSQVELYQSSNNKRRSSLAETRMMRTLSKHDLLITNEPRERRRRGSMESTSTDSSGSTERLAKPYTELFDKDRFDKFCLDTRKLSLTSANDIKGHLNITENDPTGFMGDMNEYLRRSNKEATRRRGSSISQDCIEVEEDSDLEGNIQWDDFVHPRTIEQLKG